MITETLPAATTEADQAASPMSFTFGDPVPVIDAYDFFIMGAPARKTGTNHRSIWPPWPKLKRSRAMTRWPPTACRRSYWASC